MNVLYMSAKDLAESKYQRKGKWNTLETKYGTGSTLSFCGKLKSTQETRYGPRFTIEDPDRLTLTVGRFNENVKEDAKEIMNKFKEKKDIHLLLYANPYMKEKRLYMNVNQDNGVIEVSKETYERFHELRETVKEYLLNKKTQAKEKISEDEKTQTKEKISEDEKTQPKEKISDDKIIESIKNRDRGDGVSLKEIPGYLKDPDEMYERIVDIMESGRLYEPKPGLFKVIE